MPVLAQIKAWLDTYASGYKLETGQSFCLTFLAYLIKVVSATSWQLSSIEHSNEHDQYRPPK